MKKYISLLCLLGLTHTIQAQKHGYYYKKHEVGASVQVGLSNLYGHLPFQLNSENKVGYAIGAQYDYFVDPEWSIGFGGQYNMQTIGIYADNIKGQSQKTDWEQDDFRFQYASKGYKESWKVNSVDLPLTVQYRGLKDTDLYVRTGIKYSLTMSSKGTSTWTDLKTSGYFPKYDATLEDPLFAGFGEQEQVERTHDFDLKNRFAWIGEVGLKHSLSEYQTLYVGVYFDLGLNNQSPSVETKAKNIVDYQPVKGDALIYNSSQNSESASFKTYNFGIQLRYSIGL
ncbi:MAG: PorT family protein [Flavobacteriaceae bacterium]|jgi:hypothetical protein|nr:PorT family protein [Flavobacteriaceae bacterium]